MYLNSAYIYVRQLLVVAMTCHFMIILNVLHRAGRIRPMRQLLRIKCSLSDLACLLINNSFSRPLT